MDVELGLRCTTIVLATVILLIEAFVIAFRGKEIFTKGTLTVSLVLWAMFQNVSMILRPALSITFDSNELWMLFVIHLTAATAAGIVILFIHFECEIIHHGSLQQKFGCFLSQRKAILLAAAITDFVLFAAGPPLVFYGYIPRNLAFWVPVIFVDFTAIPYFCFFGLVLRNKIRKMQQENFTKLARSILIAVISCSIIGCFTGVVGVYSAIEYKYDWILIEICWLSDVIFNGVIFWLLARSKQA